MIRSRPFAVALCVSVFVLALQTRLSFFDSQQLSIKAFADDYARLKVKLGPHNSTRSVVSDRLGVHPVCLRPLPGPLFYLSFFRVSLEKVLSHFKDRLDLSTSVRPPPLR